MKICHLLTRVAATALLLLGLVAGLAGAQAPEGPAAPDAVPGSTFTYQGQLLVDGAAATGSCDFTFTLFDAASGGSQVGSPVNKTGVAVTAGVFTTDLDFGPSPFAGQARWLQVAVRCPPDAGYTTLVTRQALTPAPYALYSAGNWSLGGNGGTTPGTNYLGTSDSKALELKVANNRALRIEPMDVPNLIGGSFGNSVVAGMRGATISGGGYDDTACGVWGDEVCFNQVIGSFGTVGGGLGNSATEDATVGGGYTNTAGASKATVGGGGNNTASAYWATVGGGDHNTAGGELATVAGGLSNQATSSNGAIGGGEHNTAGGGSATVAGGSYNTANGAYATVSGGQQNSANSTYATVSGGQQNSAAGLYATVPGGQANSATGNYSFAAGLHAKANHTGAFLWADSTPGDFLSSSPNQFAVRANGGVTITFSSGSLRLIPHTTSPKIVAGSNANIVTPEAFGATVAGGGIASETCGGTGSGSCWNRVTGTFGTVSGGKANAAAASATVGGGQDNSAGGTTATVGGGRLNSAGGADATVGGGASNGAAGPYATVGGGANNSAGGESGTVSGGAFNAATGDFVVIAGGSNNSAAGHYGAVGGGNGNSAGGQWGVVPGGAQNAAAGNYSFAAGRRAKANHAGAFVWADSTDADYASTAVNQFMVRASGGMTVTVGTGGLRILPHATSPDVIEGFASNTARTTIHGDTYGATVGGGGRAGTNCGSASNRNCWNEITARYGTISGGVANLVSVESGTVGGGDSNAAQGPWDTVGGGRYNTADGAWCAIAGGLNNTTDGDAAAVGGGMLNAATGSWATVPGGYRNIASGDYSFAAGGNAHALHPGSFVWSDSNGTDFESTAADQFKVRARGGIQLYSNGAATTGCSISAGGGSWSCSSDRTLKENLAAVDGPALLDKLAAVPVTTWNYKSQDPAIRHMGPMAQDFYAAFGVGEDDTHISTIDADGVALAATQGLYQLAQEQASEIAGLKAQNAGLEARLAVLEAAAGGRGPAPASNQVGWLGLLAAGLVMGLVLTRRGGER